MTTRQILASKLVAGLLIVLLAFLANSEFKQWRQTRAINQLKNDLQKQADLQDKKNQELADSINLINSADFQEQVARQQLNLKKNGEIVYGFTQGQDASGTDLTAGQEAVSGGSNPRKWWNYFFQ